MKLFGIGSVVSVEDVELTCVAIKRDHVVLSDGSTVDFKTIEACF